MPRDSGERIQVLFCEICHALLGRVAVLFNGPPKPPEKIDEHFPLEK